MSAAAGAGGTSLPPIRDIIGALRKAASAVVKVAGIVERIGPNVPHSVPVDQVQQLGRDLYELPGAVQELEEAVNQLVTDELEDDLRTDELERAVTELGVELRNVVQQMGTLQRNVVAESDARLRVLEELTAIREQNDRIAQRVSTHELEIATLKRVVVGNAGLADRINELEAAAQQAGAS